MSTGNNIRLDWADVAKGIGIFLMVMGHSGLPMVIHDWIYSFHMPFFFILSGYFFKSGKYKTVEYIVRKFRTIIVPYVFFVISIEILRFCGDSLELNIPSPRSIQDVVVYGRDLGATWFLTSLFFTEIIYYLLNNLFKDKRWLLFLSILSFFVSYYCYKTELHFPYKIEILGATTMYYCIGNVFAQTKWKDCFTNIYAKDYRGVFILAVLLAIDIVASNLIEPVLNLRLNRLGLHVLTLLLIIYGSLLLVQCSHLIANIDKSVLRPIKELFRYIGEYSMVLIGFSQITLQILKALVEYLNLPSFAEIAIRYILLWVIMLLLIGLFKNYMPILIGKTKKQGR